MRPALLPSLLPSLWPSLSPGSGGNSGNGGFAMGPLTGEMPRRGSTRASMEAKVFGGGTVVSGKAMVKRLAAAHRAASAALPAKHKT